MPGDAEILRSVHRHYRELYTITAKVYKTQVFAFVKLATRRARYSKRKVITMRAFGFSDKKRLLQVFPGGLLIRLVFELRA